MVEKKEETFAEKIARENREKFKLAAKQRKAIREKQIAEGTIPGKKITKEEEKKETGTGNPPPPPAKKEPKLLPNGIILPVEYPDIRALAVEKGFINVVGEDGKKPGFGEVSLITFLTAWKPEEKKETEAPKEEEREAEKEEEVASTNKPKEEAEKL